MIGANGVALEQAPKAIRVRGMDVPAHVLCPLMVYSLVWVLAARASIPAVLVGRHQGHTFIHRLPHELAQGHAVGILDDVADHIPLAGDRADDGRFGSALPVPVTVLILPTGVGFINFDFAHELAESGILHGRSGAMAHIPGRAVVAAPDLVVDLQRAHPLLALRHQVDDLKPGPQGIVGVLEHGLRDDGEAVAIPASAVLGLTGPVKRAGLESIDLLVPAAWTADAMRSTKLLQVRLAGVLGRELIHQFDEGHRRLGSHDAAPLLEAA